MGSSIGMHRIIRFVPLVAAAVLCTACPPETLPGGPGAGIVVTTTADVSAAGDGLVSLREAMEQASTDGIDSTIQVTPGATYELTDCAAGSLRHDDTHTLALTAGSGPRATVRQTCQTRVLSLSGGAADLRHLVIRGGRLGSVVNCSWPLYPTCNRGAGIDATSPVTLDDVEMTDNLANLGPGGTIGGAFVAGAGATISNSSFHDNTSDRWGGAIASYGALTIRTSVFTANHALEGNAIAVQSGSAVIEDTRFEANTGGSGGAIVMRGTELVLRRSVLRGNQSGGGPGAAVWVDAPATSVVLDHTAVVQNTGRAGALTSFGAIGDYRIVDSTVTDNVATMNIRDQYNASAGGLAISGGSQVAVHGSTIAYNSAPPGGGSNFDLTPANGTTITLSDSVVSDPLGGGTNCALRSSSFLGSTVFVSDGSCDRPTSIGSASLGPLSAVGSSWARTPLATSALRDVHVGPCATTTDQVGSVRPTGPACDYGAIEQ